MSDEKDNQYRNRASVAEARPARPLGDFFKDLPQDLYYGIHDWTAWGTLTFRHAVTLSSVRRAVERHVRRMKADLVAYVIEEGRIGAREHVHILYLFRCVAPDMMAKQVMYTEKDWWAHHGIAQVDIYDSNRGAAHYTTKDIEPLYGGQDDLRSDVDDLAAVGEARFFSPADDVHDVIGLDVWEPDRLSCYHQKLRARRARTCNERRRRNRNG